MLLEQTRAPVTDGHGGKPCHGRSGPTAPAWGLALGPVLAGGLASALMLALEAGWLIASSPPLEALLRAMMGVAIVASFALGLWQHRALASLLRPLSQPDAGGADTSMALEPASAHTAGGAPSAEIERDRLTRLLASSALHGLAPGALAAARRSGARLLLVVLDIERLRDINGTYGYVAGDQVLRQLARRLSVACPSPSLVARPGGDRFALLMPLSRLEEDAGYWLGVIAATLAHPLRLQGHALNVTVNAGAALFPEHAGSFQHLLRAAEQALETARRGEGRRWCLFDPRQDRAAATQKLLEKELRLALERNALVLHYQPQVNLGTGRVAGVEALLRWPHPEKGLVPPQDFIPLAEASGLIRPIGAWVLGEAARAARRWRDQGLDITVSVNVSAAQLRRQDLVGHVGQVLLATGLPAEALELELTESMFVDPAKLAVHRAIEALAAMGVRLAIDDFGTGYSSLGYLKRLPVDKIKIDKSFVRGLDRDPADTAIVRSIIGLARVFGKRVLAEGVEEANQLRFLRREGCDEAQGFYFSRPMPEAACTAFLLRHDGFASPDEALAS